MKYFFSILIFICLFSCNDNTSKSTSEDKVQLRKIDPCLNEIFTFKYINYKENSLVKEQALKHLINKIDSLAPLNYLEDIPVEVFRIKKNPHGKGAVVQFFTHNYERDKNNLLSNQLNFDIIGLMSEELASSLKENLKYYIFGRKYKRLNNIETYMIVNQTYFSPEPEISNDVIYSDVYNFNVGVFISEIDSVKFIK